MSNYPDGVSEHSSDAPWNQGMSDEELDRISKAASAGLFHARELADVLDELNLYFEIYPIIKKLEEMV